MRYFKLLYDYEHDKNYIYCTAEKTYDIDQYDLTKGQIIDNWNKDITFAYNPNEGSIQTDFLANNYRWLIVSEKFQKLMEYNAINLIQYLPVRIYDKDDGSDIEGYKIANVILAIDALDLEYSVYDIFDVDENEKIISIEKYAIKGEKVAGKHIFKLKDNTIPIFVSEEFKNIILRNNLIGFDFLEVLVT